MTSCFNAASAVYLVLPEDISQQDLRAHQERVSDSYAAALSKADAQFVVNLSSIGSNGSSTMYSLRHISRRPRCSDRSFTGCFILRLLVTRVLGGKDNISKS
jgi:hypothetical protein